MDDMTFALIYATILALIATVVVAFFGYQAKKDKQKK